MIQVEYRQIADYPGYRFGSDGSVWSCIQTTGRLCSVWKPKKPSRISNGYLYIGLASPSGRITTTVHALILTAFAGPCQPGMECRHLNGDRIDNRIANLAWGTRIENHADKKIHKTQPLGERHVCAILTEEIVKAIRKRRKESSLTYREIGEEFGVNFSTVRSIVCHRNWKHVA